MGCREYINKSHVLSTASPSISQLSSSQPATGKMGVSKGVPILLYHKVSPDPRVGGLLYRVPPDNFDWQMRFLKQKAYHTVDIGDVVDHYLKGKDLPENPVVITFDDGYYDNYKYAFRILRKYSLTATIFIVINTVGRLNEFDLKDCSQPKTEMLDWDEIIEMDANGFTMAAHTLDHVHLTKIKRKKHNDKLWNPKLNLKKC